MLARGTLARWADARTNGEDDGIGEVGVFVEGEHVVVVVLELPRREGEVSEAMG